MTSDYSYKIHLLSFFLAPLILYTSNTSTHVRIEKYFWLTVPVQRLSFFSGVISYMCHTITMRAISLQLEMLFLKNHGCLGPVSYRLSRLVFLMLSRCLSKCGRMMARQEVESEQERWEEQIEATPRNLQAQVNDAHHGIRGSPEIVARIWIFISNYDNIIW